MRLRQLVVAILCVSVVFAVPRGAAAQWHPVDCLPGLCGPPLRPVLIAVGIAAGSALVVYKILGRDKPDGLRPLTGKIELEKGATHAEIGFVNASTSRVRVVSIALRQGTVFQLAPGVSVPVELAPQQGLRFDVFFSPGAPGKYQDEVVVSIRGSAAEKVRQAKVRVRAAASEPLRLPALAGAIR